jgi:hypothetical protein
MPGQVPRNDNSKDSVPFFCNAAYDPYMAFYPHHTLINDARNAKPTL